MNTEKAVDKIMGIVKDAISEPIRCSPTRGCGQLKSPSEFHVDKYRKSGYKAICKDCCSKELKDKKDKNFPIKTVQEKIILDFSTIKDGDVILEILKNKAETELRSVENMIIYLLRGMI